jgi:hypothetical protein
MDLGPLIVLGLMWVVLIALRKAGSKPPTSDRRPPPVRVPPPAPPDASRTGTVRQRPPPGSGPGLDATQREGSQLEQLLRELGRTLDQTRGPIGRVPDRRLPPAEEVEERGSLEVAPEGRSLEAEPARGERALVNQDDEAEQIIQRRLAAAEGHLTPLSAADHQVFDQRIRQEPADKTATRAYTTKQLRNAVVWREILGPPVSLRREGEG